MMLVRESEPGFRIGLHHKDMGIAFSAVRDAGSPGHPALLNLTEALNAPS